MGLKSAASSAVRWFTGGKWDPSKTAQDAYIDFLARMGNVGEDRDIIEEIGDQDKVEWNGKVSKIVLSRSNISRYRENFERVDASLDLLNYAKEVKLWNASLPSPDPEITELEDKLALILKQCSMEVVGFSMPGLEDTKNLVIDKPIMLDNSGGQRYFDPSQGRQGGEKSAGFSQTVKKA